MVHSMHPFSCVEVTSAPVSSSESEIQRTQNIGLEFLFAFIHPGEDKPARDQRDGLPAPPLPPHERTSGRAACYDGEFLASRQYHRRLRLKWFAHTVTVRWVEWDQQQVSWLSHYTRLDY